MYLYVCIYVYVYVCMYVLKRLVVEMEACFNGRWNLFPLWKEELAFLWIFVLDKSMENSLGKHNKAYN